MIYLLHKLKAYGLLIRLHQPVGIYLLGFPALWALWLASLGHPDPLVAAKFVLGVILTRSAGCAINDYADRHIDLHVKRTRHRPLASGMIKPIEALLVFAVLGLAAFAVALSLNERTVWLSGIGAILMIVYPFLKRVFSLPQAWLGLAFTWSVPMAFSALSQPIDLRVWVLFMAGVLWTLVYDTEYAMVDRDDDQHLPIRSTALLFDRHDRLIIGIIQILMIALLLFTGYSYELKPAYFVGVTVAGLLFGYQQWLIRAREREACFRAFRHNVWVGLSLWLGLVGSFLI